MRQHLPSQAYIVELAFNQIGQGLEVHQFGRSDDRLGPGMYEREHEHAQHDRGRLAHGPATLIYLMVIAVPEPLPLERPRPPRPSRLLLVFPRELGQVQTTLVGEIASR